MLSTSMKCFSAIALLVCLTLTIPLVAVSQRTTSNSPTPVGTQRIVSQETYRRVLETIFPRDITGAREYSLLFRISPHSRAESQVSIIKRGNDQVEVIEYRSASGNVYAKLNQMIADGVEENAVEMAKQIKVMTRRPMVSAVKVKRWRTELLNYLPQTSSVFMAKNREFRRGVVDLPLHGTNFELWIEQGLDSMSFSVYDQAIEVPSLVSDFKLSYWIRKIDMEIVGSK